MGQAHLSRSAPGSYEADDFFSVPEDNPLKGFVQAADEAASEAGDPEQAPLALVGKRLNLDLKRLSDEERKR